MWECVYWWTLMHTKGRPEEDLGALLYHCLPYALEAGSLTEFGARQTDGRSQPSACLSLPPMVLGLQAHSQLFCGCWGLELWSSCFIASALTHQAISPVQNGSFLTLTSTEGIILYCHLRIQKLKKKEITVKRFLVTRLTGTQVFWILSRELFFLTAKLVTCAH